MTISESLTDIEKAVIASIPENTQSQAEEVRRIIQTRTASGYDITGSTFAPYSESYGKRRKGGRLSPVTLIDKGDMLPSIRVDRVRGGHAVVMPQSQMHKARPLHTGRSARAPMPARRFWGLSGSESQMLFERFGRQMVVSLGRRRQDGNADLRTVFKIGIR